MKKNKVKEREPHKHLNISHTVIPHINPMYYYGPAPNPLYSLKKYLKKIPVLYLGS